MKNILYGDGINDDTPAIQEMLDTMCEVSLPAPKVRYLITRPLEIPSGCRLVLPRFAEIRLAEGSNCVMLKNKTRDDHTKRTDIKLFAYLNYYSPDFVCENISVEGGIWNFNNKQQNPNPISNGKYEPEGYMGFGFLFYNLRNFKMSSLTLKDPCNFAVTMDTVSYFSISDITFDFNEGNLYQSNMDGIHMNGNCHHGHIERLFGTCYDDIVAMNAQEGSAGPISDITIKGIYTKGSYSAARLLSASPECAVRNVHISDVHGTFYHFCVSFQHYYDTGKRGCFENVTVENVYASKSDRDLVKFYRVHNYRKYGIIDLEGKNDMKNITIRDVHRCESIDDTPTVKIFRDTDIDNITISNITSENKTGLPEIPMIESGSDVKNVKTDSLFADGKEIFWDGKATVK